MDFETPLLDDRRTDMSDSNEREEIKASLEELRRAKETGAVNLAELQDKQETLQARLLKLNREP